MTLTDIGAAIPAAATTTPDISVQHHSSPARPAAGTDPMVVVPAGFVADLLGSIAPTISEKLGGFWGHPTLGKTVGQVAEPLIKLLPFQVVVPGVVPQSAGPAADSAAVADQSAEAMVVVPAGFLGGILGGIAGNVLGGTVGSWFGSKGTGATIGNAVGGIAGGFLPFQVVPPELMPASAGPQAAAPAATDAMVVVPAGFFGDLLSGATSCFGDLTRGSTVGDIVKTASPLLKLLPFQTVAPDLLPAATGSGTSADEELVVVPAGWFGSTLASFAETIGGQVGSLFGDAQTGSQVGKAAAPFINMLPFSTVPPALVPAAAGPDGTATTEQMLFVPAGFFGGLLKSWSGVLGGVAGEITGSKTAGSAVGGIAGAIGGLLPFSVVPS